MNRLLGARISGEARAIWQRALLARVAPVSVTGVRPAASRDFPFPRIFKNEEISRRWLECEKQVLPAIGKIRFNGAVNDGDRQALFYLIHFCQPRSVLEIGTRFGASTVYLAYAMKQLWGRDGRLITIDIQNVNDRSSGMYRCGRPAHTPLDHMAMLDCLDIVEFVTAPSHEYLASTDAGFDFIFIDGSHRADFVYRDIVGALRRLNPGGFIFMHDFYPNGRPLWRNAAALPGPHLAVERVLRECPWLEVLPFGTLPWPTRPGSRTTSLAALVASARAHEVGQQPGPRAKAVA